MIKQTIEEYQLFCSDPWLEKNDLAWHRPTLSLNWTIIIWFAIPNWHWISISSQLNTETGLLPFLFCQSNLHLEFILACPNPEPQLILICLHKNHISFTINEICFIIIVLLVGVGEWATKITEKETSMTNLSSLNKSSMSTPIFALIWSGFNHIADSQTNTNPLLYKKLT